METASLLPAVFKMMFLRQFHKERRDDFCVSSQVLGPEFGVMFKNTF